MKCQKCGKENHTLVQVSHEVNGEVLLKLYCVTCLFVPVFRGVKPAVVSTDPFYGRRFRNAEEQEEACWDEPDNVC